VNDTDRRSLRLVLDGVRFPARRWEIITAATWYGVDSVTGQRLEQLPNRDQPYRDLQDLVTTLDRVIAGRQDSPTG
jgi:hypothetical protein